MEWSVPTLSRQAVKQKGPCNFAQVDSQKITCMGILCVVLKANVLGTHLKQGEEAIPQRSGVGSCTVLPILSPPPSKADTQCKPVGLRFGLSKLCLLQALEVYSVLSLNKPGKARC